MPKVLINEIRVNPSERQREDLGDIEGLSWSLKEYGQLENVGLDRQNNLLYGFRRLTAAIMLGWDTINAEYTDQVDATRAQMIEMEENVRRHNLSWQEESKAIARIHRLKIETDSVWTSDKTAEMLGISRRKVFNSLELSTAVDKLPDVAKAETQAGAMMRLTQLKQLEDRKVIAQGRAQQEEMGLRPKTDVKILLGDAYELLKEIPSESVDFGVSNPPYGVDIESVFIGDRTIYEDAEKDIVPLLYKVAKEMYRVLKNDRWFVWFYPDVRRDQGKDILVQAGFTFQQVPCVWYKPNKFLSSLSNPYQNFSSQYESFFWGRKGSPRFNKLRLGNVFVYDTPDRDDRIHPLQMPVELWTEILEIGSVEGESILEPFAGSGSCGVACIQASRNYTGLELSAEYVSRAQMWFSETRAGIKLNASATIAPPISEKLPDAGALAAMGFKL